MKYISRPYQFTVFLALIIQFTFTACTKDLITLEKKKKQREIGLVLYQYQSGTWEERIDAVLEISKYKNNPGYRKALRLLIAATYDIHAAVRITAIRNLKLFPSPQSIKRLHTLADSKSNTNQQWYALQTLAHYRNPISARLFVKGLRSRDWLIREISAKGLLMIKSLPVFFTNKKYVLRALRDTSEPVRLAVLNTITIKDEKIYHEIIKIFKRKK